MLKPILLASAMMISVPALAQEVPSQTPTAPSQGTTVPTTDPAMPDTTAPAPTDSTVPTDPTTTTAPEAGDTSDPSAAQTADPQTTQEPQTASTDQIGQIVDTEFPTYAKTSADELTKDEFGQWMVALRTASEPGVNAQSAEVQTWTSQAFASADADQSGKVTKTELKTFLSQGA